MRVSRRVKSYFLHGLAVLLPTILTIWLFVWSYTFIQRNFSVHINRGLVRIVALVTNESVEISDKEVIAYVVKAKPELEGKDAELAIHAKRPEMRRKARIQKLEASLQKTWVHGPGAIVGFLTAVIVVCVVGALLASYVGRSLWRTVEKFIMNTPILRSVFPYVKQITDFLLTAEEQKQLFSRVVAVEYPRKGIWSLGFVTGAGLEKVVRNVRREFLTVLIPTSPTPFTGFVITVQKRLTIDLDMSIEEALRFIVSGGVITPGSEPAAAGLPKSDAERVV